VLKGQKERSPLARGDHDPVEDPDVEDAPDIIVTIDGQPASERVDEMCEDRGLLFLTALALAREHNDQGLDDLPPQGVEAGRWPVQNAGHADAGDSDPSPRGRPNSTSIRTVS
jgi:hypothetical protein